MITRRFAFALTLFALPPNTWAQSLPESIRACAADIDPDRRHACYDREVRRILNSEKGATRAPVPDANRARQRTAPPAGDRITARIVSVDTTADELVLHLDNGQIWEQTDRTSGGLGLRAGDTVRIEKHLGSYWLSARHLSGMRVRRKSD